MSTFQSHPEFDAEVVRGIATITAAKDQERRKRTKKERRSGEEEGDGKRGKEKEEEEEEEEEEEREQGIEETPGFSLESLGELEHNLDTAFVRDAIYGFCKSGFPANVTFPS